jgi:hypothetical protein
MDMHRAYGTNCEGVAFFINVLKPVATRWVEPLPLPVGRYGSG